MLPSELPNVQGWAVACDTETSGLHPDDDARVSVVSVAWVCDDCKGSSAGCSNCSRGVVAHAWPFDQGSLDKRAQTTMFEQGVNLDAEQWVALLQWLNNQRLVFHNAKFDLHMLAAGTRAWSGISLIDQLWWDTQIVAKEVNPVVATALKLTAERYGLLQGGEREHEQRVKNYLRKNKLPKGRYDLVPWEIMEPYATNDADMTIRLYLLQRRQLQTGELDWQHVQQELDVCRLLYRMESRGVAFDTAGCVDAAIELKKARDELGKQLPFNPSINSAKKFFFQERGVMPYEVTDGGAPQLNDSVLRKMVTDEIEWAQQYQQWRKMDVALSMWYEGYPAKVGNDGRLRTSYHQTQEQGAETGGGGTVSGRFSVKRINLQAIPHQSRLDGLPPGTPTPRQFLVPGDGMQLYEIDLKQAELRVAARYARCYKMIEMMVAGEDMHGYTATELFGVKEGHPEWFKYRQIGKRGNFSLGFGAGADTFRTMLFKESGIDLGRNEADEIVQGWRRLYPEFGRAIRNQQRVADQRQYVELVNRKRRWFFPGEYTHKAFNQQVQGSLAEFAKEWARQTERIAPGQLVLLIHDSEVLEIPLEADHEAIMNEIAAVAETVGTAWFDVEMGADWSVWGEHE